MSSRIGRGYERPMDRRSRSSSAHPPQPYHAISEVYTKEITHHPIGPASEYPPEVIEMLREEPRAPHTDGAAEERTHTPPLIRSRENTWTPENFPIVRVPSAQFTDIMTELYDYHEVEEKYTRRSVTPDPAPLRSPPTYQVIPPTPEKTTPRHHQGIPLTTSEKKPLPMYEEYVKMQRDENRNVPRPKSPSSGASESNKVNNNEKLRHIDSSSSESVTDSEATIQNSGDVKNTEDPGKRYVVYFKPSPHPIQSKNCYEIRRNLKLRSKKDIVLPTLRPSRSSTILSRSASSNPSVPMDHRRAIPTRTSVLRKEHEILTVPLNRSQSVRQSRISEQSRRSTSKTVTERSIPVHLEDTQSINMDDIFPKMPHPQTVTNVHPQSRSSTVSRVPDVRGSIDKGDYPRQHRTPSVVSRNTIPVHSGTPDLPFTRGISKTPSVQDYKAKRPSERSPSFLSSHAPSHKTTERSPSEVRIPVTVQSTAPISQHRPHEKPHEKRPSPEELDYGRFPNGQSRYPGDHVRDLQYTRGVSKTPSDKDYRVERTPPSTVHIPYNNPEKERAYQVAKSIPSARSSYRSETNKSLAPSERYSNRVPHEETPELPFTRGISKTPSDTEKRSPSSTVHIPFNNPEKERAYQQSQASPKHRPSGRTQSPSKPRVRSPSAKARPTSQGPFEEIVHIKERYERDETIRRFFPTTTTV
ncbi:CRE-CNP-2 protein [Caenorhabditis remanei]|uniref:CRE-CNP-2 protein n=1 Tax=Caenorhabditis remanei TaxID=31234 RepID=E3MVD6_CAERE|nr:CRE-CNP-2 protein [Caenorhabditis remanei]